MTVEKIPNTADFVQCVCQRIGCSHGKTCATADGGQRCAQGADYLYHMTKADKHYCRACALAVGLPQA